MSSITLPARILNRSSRQWVFGSPQSPFIVPPGVPTARVVDVPERFHARSKVEANHAADDARDEKFRRIFAEHLSDPNSGLEALTAGKVDPVVEKARADEIETLRQQNEKLQRIVAAGEGAAAIEELQEKLAKAQSDAKALFDQLNTAIGERDSLSTQLSSKVSELGSAQNRITELEGQLKAALQPKKK